MDNIKQAKADTSDIPQKIFTQFIEGLKTTDIPPESIQQLEQTIVVNGNLSEQAIRAALTPQSAS